jgi:hypothetical protein
MRNRQIQIGTILVAVLLLAGWSCSYTKTGQLAKDVAASVLVAQQVEIQAHKGGYIDDTLHQGFQNELLALADAGVRLDAAINQAHSAKGAVAEISVMNKLLSDLSQNKLAGIKDQNTKLALQAAFLTIQTTLDNIAAFGGK